jgi:hypothetical protein
MRSLLVIGYLDDISAGGELDVLASDVNMVMREAKKLGLSLNLGKCEICTSVPATELPQVFKQFKILSPNDTSLLGSPLLPGTSMDAILDHRCTDLERAVNRFPLISAHDALVILKNCLGSGKMIYILRTSPCSDHTLLSRFDSLLRKALAQITNSNISDINWVQASLPVASGGLGIRSVVLLAPSAFLASAAATLDVQQSLLPGCSTVDPFVDITLDTWRARHPNNVVPSVTAKQRNWDAASVAHGISQLTNLSVDPSHQARIKACLCPHAGDWLHALPITSCGLRLDDEAVRVAVGLRLGLELCEPHACPCGAMVGPSGVHGLSCKKSSGRSARHSILNDLVCRALVRAMVPAVREPPGLTRSDGKRPDGVTLIPWQMGKRLTWDVTVCDTLAPSYLQSTSVNGGAAAEAADIRKQTKYVQISNNHIFCALAFETLGPINSEGLKFLLELGNRLAKVTGDTRETAYLLQRISIVIQRGNAVAFTGSFIDVFADEKLEG